MSYITRTFQKQHAAAHLGLGWNTPPLPSADTRDRQTARQRPWTTCTMSHSAPPQDISHSVTRFCSCRVARALFLSPTCLVEVLQHIRTNNHTVQSRATCTDSANQHVANASTHEAALAALSCDSQAARPAPLSCSDELIDQPAMPPAAAVGSIACQCSRRQAPLPSLFGLRDVEVISTVRRRVQRAAHTRRRHVLGSMPHRSGTERFSRSSAHQEREAPRGRGGHGRAQMGSVAGR